METFLLAFTLLAQACNCAGNVQTQPLLNVDSLTGPKGPGPYESASSWNAPNWGLNSQYDGFGWGGWPVDFY